MIPTLVARWRWAYLGSAMLKPAKSLIDEHMNLSLACQGADQNMESVSCAIWEMQQSLQRQSQLSALLNKKKAFEDFRR